MTKLSITKEVVKKSISLLKSSVGKEKVILWLGYSSDESILANEIYVPIQISDYDYFKIPEKGMDELLKKIKSSGKVLVAQIHTHPFEAFHSKADNNWAIIRHLNAYSIVIPFFCQKTTSKTFLNHAVSFALTADNRWVEIDNQNLLII